MACVNILGDENGRIGCTLHGYLTRLEPELFLSSLPEAGKILLIAPGFDGEIPSAGVLAAVCCSPHVHGEGFCFLRCGMSERDTFSFSSIGEKQALAAVSREIVTLTGSVIEKQELLLSLPEHIEPLAALGVAAVLLLLGCPPELLP